MTRDDIEKRAKQILDGLAIYAVEGPPIPGLTERVAGVIREAVTEAYEEAAEEAESFTGQEPWYDTHASETGEAEAIASAIRALKDSL